MAKIFLDFAINFFKTSILKSSYPGLQKENKIGNVKPKTNAGQHFKVGPVSIVDVQFS